MNDTILNEDVCRGDAGSNRSRLDVGTVGLDEDLKLLTGGGDDLLAILEGR